MMITFFIFNFFFCFIFIESLFFLLLIFGDDLKDGVILPENLGKIILIIIKYRLKLEKYDEIIDHSIYFGLSPNGGTLLHHVILP